MNGILLLHSTALDAYHVLELETSHHLFTVAQREGAWRQLQSGRRKLGRYLPQVVAGERPFLTLRQAVTTLLEEKGVAPSRMAWDGVKCNFRPDVPVDAVGATGAPADSPSSPLREVTEGQPPDSLAAAAAHSTSTGISPPRKLLKKAPRKLLRRRP